MSKTLITLFSTKSDILSCGHFINSYKKENPHSEITLITTKENHRIA